MEITAIETHVLKSDVDSTSIPSIGAVEVGSVLVEVHTDEDVTGYGESFHRQRVEDNIVLAHEIESLEQYLVGTDPREISERWSELYVHVKRSGAYKALSAIDEALWDIAGKRAGLPVYELLGGYHGDLSAYATFPIQKEADELVEDAHWLAEKGFESLKITAGLGVERDRERIETIASNLPDGFRLAIDANTSYDFTDALRLANAVEEHDLVWFEEPIAHTDTEGYAEFRRQAPTPLAGFQTHTPHYSAVEMLQAGALDIYQPSLDNVGGITAAHRVAVLAEAFNKRIVPHAFGPAVNYTASLHLAAASPACSLIEFCVLSDDIDDPGEFIASPFVANQDELSVADGGEISPPDRPGLGIELDRDVLEEYRIEH
ncbi:mandelate racemase/muconate lactonizing enzyme family protein [Natrialba sp. INN-245]|uniref:mandelate racemase/muconate lactonizing enzyme family protein n=1 Tax=Natrialba sp. INN-245 TaxID=2690967 RepID=UPI00131066D0|nr:mandelate racemase/muconate lactonizing enzyme family protein [Natrialba sp. INN-245]MWV38423.1 mandelate racemase/muconate lactonizing enzyme family protein [Natrialba sp. INN-245]